MLSINAISADMADNYYKHDNYYSTEKPGEWLDTSASRALGLSGQIADQDWHRIVRGQDPRTGEQLVQAGVNGKHRAGTDLTFSAPKSLSIAALIGGRQDLIEAHREAVEAVLGYIEKHGAQIRMTQNGETEFVKTSNLLVAKFEHGLSREKDCQLHTHAVVLNMTKHGKAWKAVSNEALFENKMLYGQIYRNELAANLRELGYQIEPGKHGLFEIAGVDKTIRDEFSRRSQQIKEMIDQLREKYPNANDSELKEMATLGSRAAKDKKADMTVIRENWNERLQGLGKSKDELNQAIDQTRKDHGKEVMTARDAVHKAAEIITEQESAFSREDLLRLAGRFSLGRSRIADLERAAKKLIQSGELILLSDGTLTTLEMQGLEREIITMMREGQGKFSPIMTPDDAQRAISGRILTSSQKEFILHAATTRDHVIGVQGYAGVGKTFALDTFRQILESRGLTAKALAYTGKA
ncbi:MAG TPA: MobF family relaxase, partial [Nitrospirota bacterium]|nr:MobF family relaxase [Nitrospirota bacterium]